MPRRIELHIESLVLNGVDVDRGRLAEAVQSELQRMLASAERSGAASAGRPDRTAGRWANHATGAGGHSPESVGTHIAHAIHGSLPR